ncbi:MAG: sulfite oxidase [Chloroflexota bacterium]|nr:sulfite oxidase [Chloroflexota bacterium]
MSGLPEAAVSPSLDAAPESERPNGLQPGPAPTLTRRGFTALGSAVAGAFAAGVLGAGRIRTAVAEHVPGTPTAERPPPEENTRVFSPQETTLAFRNYGMPAEFLDRAITPLGAHYLLVHFDIPTLSSDDYSLVVGGCVDTPLVLGLEELKSRPVVTQAVTMECAGTGRSTMAPRAIYVPWAYEAIGTYEWVGTPLRPLLEEAGLLKDAVEILFTGWDTGVDLGVEHAFERSLPIAEALRDEVMLAWAANGQSLLPQHGFPLRLVVPAWYGMTSVKWLRAITVLNEPFQGVQQAQVYRYQRTKDDPGDPVTLKRVHSVMKPPGIPDLLSRHRFLAPGRHVLRGMAWSGSGIITRVEVSTDDGVTWQEAILARAGGTYAWTPWRIEWTAEAPGEYVLASRATDAVGNSQPLDPNAVWNRQGMGGNGVQRIDVTVQEGVGVAGLTVPSTVRMVIPGAEVPPTPASPVAESLATPSPRT